MTNFEIWHFLDLSNSLDLQSSKPFSLFLVCFLFSSLDALLTLLALTTGEGYERNVVLALFVATALYRRFWTWLLSRWMRRHGSRRRQLLLGKPSERYEWVRRLASKIDVEEVRTIYKSRPLSETATADGISMECFARLKRWKWCRSEL